LSVTTTQDITQYVTTHHSFNLIFISYLFEFLVMWTILQSNIDYQDQTA